jgi:cyclophilin family peptidyl-prolyl cis-trans isomerase
MKSFAKVSLTAFVIFIFWSCSTEPKPTINTEEQRKTLEMVTDYGTMTIALYNETPLHRDNFVNLAQNGAFDSLLFHRVIEQFMIQSGDPDSRKAQPGDALGEGDAPYLVNAEFNPNLFHKKGVLAAARDDDPGKRSSAMQFYLAQGKVYNDSLLDVAETYTNKWMAQEFFGSDPDKKTLLDSLRSYRDNGNRGGYNILADSVLALAQTEKGFVPYTIPEDQRAVYKSQGGVPFLDQNYTVFGEVIEGIAVIDSIAKVRTDSLDRPVVDVRIVTVRLKQ